MTRFSLFAAALAACPGIATAADAQKLKLSQDIGHPTAATNVSGSGFGDSEAVDIYFDTTDMLLDVTTPKGTFTARQLPIPATATPGQHWITVIGRKSGDAAQLAFTVETDWVQSGFGPHSKRVNPYENVLTAGNASALDVDWAATTQAAIYSSPAMANGVVYVGSEDDKLYALNATTGATLWSAATGNAIFSSPAQF